ncbi:MAG TPA: MBL fold metallo-hydrolase [Leptolyngbyaceae cyanobacterium M33_DOE_097]|uniref:MBL fold metallo-hydrolase n=1 Tax=Oscillatoriales cyanobacterium SpSt-418 TaxID=2282169 RepID=A0A7C3KGS4_9CYAN|nr:MBL fold metallo-hydrolase [Leptolyngbyaceae cyanobacterium M33_DOE_097]
MTWRSSNSSVSELECLAYGVEQRGEGICLLLRIGGYRILLDCGVADTTPLTSKKVPPADMVLCSHAHADHARGLLSLYRAFPNLPIYASEVTTQLLPLNWSDPVPESFCHALPWRTPIEFFDGLTACLYPAGHLPGAAAFVITYTPPRTVGSARLAQRPYTVVYTGDYFLSNSRLVEGLPLDELRGMAPDVLIVEGSYGTARHPHRRQQENQFAERVSRAIAENYRILLPTASLGLAQELLMLLRSHHHFTGKDFTIWVDDAIATACDAYLEILPHLPMSVQNFARHQPLFWDEKVRPRMRRLSTQLEQGIALTDLEAPCIVLCEETADLSAYYQTDPDSWLILLPQEPHRVSQATSGVVSDPSIASAALRSRLGIPHTETYLLAQHCDGPGTTQLIHNLRPQHVILVHGSPSYLADLAGLEELQNRYQLHTPITGVTVELPIGETFLQPAAPENSYEGELTEIDTFVTITLPGSVTTDPRWRILADTGLIEARWQGDELVLRGLPQRELLRQGSDRLTDWLDVAPPTTRSCCATCRHFRGQRCWNARSPLFELKVTPEGSCPVYEAALVDPQPE